MLYIGLGKSPISFENCFFQKHYNSARYDRYKEELSLVPDLKSFLLKRNPFSELSFLDKN